MARATAWGWRPWWRDVTTAVLLAALALPLLPLQPAAAAPGRIMPVGDSVTAGGSSAVDTYWFPLYEHYASSSVDWTPVGPNRPRETMNGLAKRIKQVAFDLRTLVHHPVRVLL
jgi:hypothetical protein